MRRKKYERDLKKNLQECLTSQDELEVKELHCASKTCLLR
jgi:hypothetical protein